RPAGASVPAVSGGPLPRRPRAAPRGGRRSLLLGPGRAPDGARLPQELDPPFSARAGDPGGRAAVVPRPARAAAGADAAGEGRFALAEVRVHLPAGEELRVDRRRDVRAAAALGPGGKGRRRRAAGGARCTD